MSSVTVHSRCGPVEGRCEDGVCRFLGIPYAHAERFSYPIEVTHWDGTLEALDYGPAPVPVSYTHLDVYKRQIQSGA